MSKDAHESEAPQPSGEALVQERAKPDSAAMRELVGGGAVYDDRRRHHGRMRPETPSGLIEKFSADIKRPSAAGLPSWKGDTAPGLGVPPSSDDPTEVEAAPPGAVATHKEDEAPITPVVGTPRTAMAAPAELEAPSSARMSREERDALAKEIALGVRGGKPPVPYKSRRERAEAEAKTPAEGSPKVIVKAESPKPPKAKPLEAEAVRHSREAATVAAPRDDAPPTHPEKRLERKIGAGALAFATLLVGILIGRYVMHSSPSGTASTTAPPTLPLVSAFPAALSAVSVSPEVSAEPPVVSAVAPSASPRQARQAEPVHAVPSEKPAPSAKPTGKPSGAHAAPSTAPLEPKPPSAPAPVSTDLTPF